MAPQREVVGEKVFYHLVSRSKWFRFHHVKKLANISQKLIWFDRVVTSPLSEADLMMRSFSDAFSYISFRSCALPAELESTLAEFLIDQSSGQFQFILGRILDIVLHV